VDSAASSAETEGGVRQAGLVQTLVRLANILIDEFDVVELLNLLAVDCVHLLGVAAAGLLLADTDGTLQVMAASSEETRLLELFQVQREEGPCFDCFRLGIRVDAVDLGQEGHRWPTFAPLALAMGFRTAFALPLRLRGRVVGTLNLFETAPRQLPDDNAALGQALADMATIVIVQERALKRSEELASELQVALSSRVVIEQAKGFLAERGGLDMEQAFRRLRTYARDHQLSLRGVASGIVDGSIDADRVVHVR
jgi:GAF domain-containing protein